AVENAQDHEAVPPIRDFEPLGFEQIEDLPARELLHVPLVGIAGVHVVFFFGGWHPHPPQYASEAGQCTIEPASSPQELLASAADFPQAIAVRDRDEDQTGGRELPAHGREQRPRFDEVLEHLRADDQIEDPIEGRERTVGVNEASVRKPIPLAASLDGIAVDVYADDLAAERRDGK